jgi:hypothetical protein
MAAGNKFRPMVGNVGQELPLKSPGHILEIESIPDPGSYPRGAPIDCDQDHTDW